MTVDIDLVAAWEAHDVWASGLTYVGSDGKEHGRRVTAAHDGAAVTDRLVRAEKAFAADVGMSPLQTGILRRRFKQEGASRTEAVARVRSWAYTHR